MSIMDVIGKRCSVRKFKPDAIPLEDLLVILKAGQMAPSATDVQGWHFIVIDDPGIKHKLVEMGAAVFIRNAPQGILVLYENRTYNTEYMDHIQSAAAAVQNILLAAAEREIGTCWVCHLPPKNQIRALLNIPKHLDPVAYIALGYYETLPVRRSRKRDIGSIVSFNTYASTERAAPRRPAVAIRRMLTNVYYVLPLFIRKKITPIIDAKFTKKFE